MPYSHFRLVRVSTWPRVPWGFHEGGHLASARWSDSPGSSVKDDEKHGIQKKREILNKASFRNVRQDLSKANFLPWILNSWECQTTAPTLKVISDPGELEALRWWRERWLMKPTHPPSVWLCSIMFNLWAVVWHCSKFRIEGTNMCLAEISRWSVSIHRSSL